MKLSNNQKYKSINNCFLNSSLECLIHCNYLRDKLHSIQDRKLNDKPLAKEFKKLITIIYEGKNIYDYYNIKEILSEIEEKYKRNQQNDANEFITIFLNKLLKELNSVGVVKEPEYPIDPKEKFAFNKL